MTREFDCDAVLLDMDGTLVDSTECVVRHWRRWAKRHQLDPEPIIEISHGRPTLETLTLVAPHLASPEEAQRLEAAEAEDRDGIKPVRGVLSLLAALPRGRWAVVTSAPKQLAERRLSGAGLPLPSVLVSADDVQKGKPDPEPFLLAARLLGVLPGRCLVFEDAPVGIQSAHSAGMEVVGITTTFVAERLDTLVCLADFEEVSISPAALAGALRVSLPLNASRPLLSR
jgi:sugar-phosphatase